MSGTCEVIGWLVDDTGTRRVVREENGATTFENVSVDGAMGGMAIQTGTFRRGKPIIDRATHECVGYELEPVASSFALG